MFGHAAASFNNANFAISYFGTPGRGSINPDPTYTDDVKLKNLASKMVWKGTPTETSKWREKLVNRNNANSFKQLLSKAYIISNEDLLKISKDATHAPGGGVSEFKAYKWWKQILKNQNFGGWDCADAVFEALEAAGCAKVSWHVFTRGLLHPLHTPDAAVAYAKEVNARIVSAMNLSKNDINLIKSNDRCWGLASGNISKGEDVETERTPVLGKEIDESDSEEIVLS